MSHEIINEVGFAATLAAVSCDRCQCRPSIEICTGSALAPQSVRVCVTCLAELTANLPPNYCEQFTNNMHGYVIRKHGRQGP